MKIHFRLVCGIGLVGCVSEFETKNFPPNLTIISPLNGEIYNEGEEIPFAVSLTDEDDSSFDLTLRWQSNVDGFLIESSPDANGELKLYTTLSAGAHQLTARVHDDEDLFVEETIEVRINVLPPAPDITVIPESPSTNEDISIVISTQPDEDGDTLTNQIQWFRNGSPVPELEGRELVSATETEKGQLWTVEVQMNDGFGLMMTILMINDAKIYRN